MTKVVYEKSAKSKKRYIVQFRDTRVFPFQVGGYLVHVDSS